MLANLKWRILLAQLILNAVVLCGLYVYLHGSLSQPAEMAPVITSRSRQWESASDRLWLGVRLTALPVSENGTENSETAIETVEGAKREFAAAVDANKDTLLRESVGTYSPTVTVDPLASHSTASTEAKTFVFDKEDFQQAGQLESNPRVSRLRFQRMIASRMDMEGKEERRQRLLEGLRLQWRSSQGNDIRQDPFRLLLHRSLLMNPREIDSSPAMAETIKEDMERCGRQLGLSEKSLHHSSNNISIASEKMALFVSVFKSFLPKDNQFLASFKNPCWYIPHADEKPTDKRYRTDLKSRRMLLCLPYFFIPGFMKSGTSSLFDALARHPDVVAPSIKEPQYWHRVPISRDYYKEPKIANDIKRYLRVFLRPSQIISMLPSSVTVDASADTINRSPYFVNSQDYCTLPIILSKVLPQAKFIVIMRNPVTRTYSHFLYACTQKFSFNITQWPEKVRSQPAELFHQQAVLSIQQFNDCLQSHSLFKCTNLWRFHSSSVDRCGEVGFRLVNSIYYSYLVRWLQFFPKEQFLFLKTEDIDSKTHELMNQIAEFLGISPLSAIKADMLFSRSRNQQRFASQEGFRLKEKTVTLLQEFFKPHNTMLAELVGDRRFLWSD